MKPSLSDRLLTIFVCLDLVLAGWYLSSWYTFQDQMLFLVL